MTVEEKLKELQEKILLCSKAYYEEDRSLISDEAFDDLMKQYRELETKTGVVLPNSPTQRVGGRATFAKVVHPIPMRSLDNVYTKEEVEKILQTFHDCDTQLRACLQPASGATTILEMKLDGLSISCRYVKGKLVQALTRGDGTIGEDVTENVRQISSIPKELKDPIDMVVFGEVVMPKKSFQIVNTKRKVLGQEEFANPRNAAAGTLRQKDPKVVAERGLDCYFYFIAETLVHFDQNKFGLKTHWECIQYLERLGFKTTGIFVPVKSLQEMVDQIGYWETYRTRLPYETDGLVLKCDCLATWRILGATAKYPKFAFAFKFKSEQVSTVLRAVEWFVGRSGTMTPVAVFDKVTLGGTQVQRASLHNYTYIKDRDLRIGDVITIKKAAEIIPQVEEVITDVRTGLEIPIPEPKICPVCGKKTRKRVSDSGIESYYCINSYCPGILKERLLQFVSRDAMNIQGLGEQTIEKLIQRHIINDIPDLYRLNSAVLISSIDHYQQGLANKLLAEIEKSKSNSMERVFTGLGIPGFGKQMIKLIVSRVHSLEEFLSLEDSQLREIPGIGEELRKNFLQWKQDLNQLDRIRQLQELGVQFRITTQTSEEGPWKHQEFLFTGTCESGTRSELEEKVISLGGSIASSVGKATVVVAGSDAEHHKKYKEAVRRGIPIWNEATFIQTYDTMIKRKELL